jgi:hypothetical protein
MFTKINPPSTRAGGVDLALYLLAQLDQGNEFGLFAKNLSTAIKSGLLYKQSASEAACKFLMQVHVDGSAQDKRTLHALMSAWWATKCDLL